MARDAHPFIFALFFGAFQDIAVTKGGDGRLPIHHAVAPGCTCLGNVIYVFNANPKGASVGDPATSLYPFMLAASNDDINASYELLLADPSLVHDMSSGGGKKRKRALSS